MVVVVDELRQDPPQVALADGDQVVEALLAGGPHPAFRDRVRTGRLNRGPQTLDSQAGGALAEVGAPDSVMMSHAQRRTTRQYRISSMKTPRCLT
jgi:hypothetical protein